MGARPRWEPEAFAAAAPPPLPQLDDLSEDLVLEREDLEVCLAHPHLGEVMLEREDLELCLV